MLIPHISELLADSCSYIADSCCCLLSCMTQGLMCFLVTGNKNRTEIVISIKKERLESLWLIFLKVPSTEILSNIVNVTQSKRGWRCPFLHSFLSARFSRAILPLAILSSLLQITSSRWARTCWLKAVICWTPVWYNFWLQKIIFTSSKYSSSRYWPSGKICCLKHRKKSGQIQLWFFKHIHIRHI